MGHVNRKVTRTCELKKRKDKGEKEAYRTGDRNFRLDKWKGDKQDR